jgi:RNA polymerase sigma-70 factor, ECF subfamily
VSNGLSANERTARFEAIFEEGYEAVLAYARRRAGTEADDIVAETFTVVWRRLDDVPTDSLPWLYGVARKVLSEERRAARRRNALIERIGEDVSRVNETDADTSPVLVALARLADRDREAVLLVAWEGLTAEQAAKAMGCSTIAFRVRLHRARKRLRARLEQLGDARFLSTSAVVAKEVENT